MTIWSAIGLVTGIAIFGALRILADWIIWRLRGQPVLGFTPPIRLGNLFRGPIEWNFHDDVNWRFGKLPPDYPRRKDVNKGGV